MRCLRTDKSLYGGLPIFNTLILVSVLILIASNACTALTVTVIYVSTGESYSVTTAQSDVLVYIDRDYTINTITDKLDDGHLVQTANDDKYVTEPNHLTLEISETATVYVCYDERQTSLPTWLNDESWEFLDDQEVIITGYQGNDERYEVYKKDFSSGQFTLGGNHQGGDTGAQSNYFVIVQPISDNEQPVVDAGDTQAIVWDSNPGAENMVELAGSVTDDDPCGLGQLTILWSQLNGPNTVEFNDVTDPCTTVRLPEPGIYELLLQAWDEVPQQASDAVKIIANKSLIVDLNKDGGINFLDLAVLGKDWPTDYDFTNLRAVSEHWLEDINTVNTTRIYLSGRDKEDAVPWEFYCTSGRKSGFWTTIPVPSNWELHGFGQYNYGHDTNKSNEKGKYRYTFAVPEFWASKKNQIVFEGAMTDTEVWINGKSAGTKHQGGFYRFKYDITDLVEFGYTNLLEVTVSKRSSNGTVEAAERKADYWVFGGIYRPVYIEALPPDFIDWTAIDARADGTFSVDVHLKHITDANNVIAQIIEPNGAHLANPFSAQISDGNDKATLNTTVINHQTWSAETPNLYKVKIDLRQGETTIHSVTERFGFRTIEVRTGEGIFLNGNRIRLKGVNRHCFWPDSGRSLSQQISYEDACLIKQMNMNTVRMSHYPPDKHFLEVCDELGLYVLNELAGWQSPPYDTVVGEKLVKEMVTFSVNHPCILFWDNGNEGGWNTDLDDDFAIYDPQNRTVLHPWANFNNIDTDHYEGYSSIQNILAGSTIFMTTEFLHGLYDGGHGAALNDYWNLMRNSHLGAGGFLWALIDEGVVRTDMNDWIDTDDNHAPDGILGPYREKEGSFYTISQIWSPIQVTMETIPPNFDGTIEVENHYDFLNLNTCTFEWQLVDFKEPNDPNFGHDVIASGQIPGPFTEPGISANIIISLPGDWQDRDALYLSAIDYNGRILWTWTWNLKESIDYRQRIMQTGSGPIMTIVEANTLTVITGELQATFDLNNGKLINAVNYGQQYSFGNGPRLVPPAASSPIVNHWPEPNHYVVEANNTNGLELFRWRIYPSGWLSLYYRYQLSGQFDYFGITFDYPEEQVLGMKWLGQGAYRVWKNRMKGTTLNVWQNDYNDNIPGQTWLYPEFKGYYSDLQWLLLQTQQGPITVANDTEDLFFRIYTPQNGSNPRNTAVAFPDGDISFLHAIPPIGTKFKPPDQLGPQSQKNQATGTYEASLYFYFGNL